MVRTAITGVAAAALLALAAGSAFACPYDKSAATTDQTTASSDQTVLPTDGTNTTGSKTGG